MVIVPNVRYTEKGTYNPKSHYTEYHYVEMIIIRCYGTLLTVFGVMNSA